MLRSRKKPVPVKISENFRKFPKIMVFHDFASKVKFFPGKNAWNTLEMGCNYLISVKKVDSARLWAISGKFSAIFVKFSKILDFNTFPWEVEKC